jgi:squalene synthase HpnC
VTTASAELRSGKGAGDENFPVASLLVRPRYRAPIMAFYEFVRVADDIADHAGLGAAEKLARLDRLEACLLGQADDEPQGVHLRTVLQERGLSPVHAQHLLHAFRQDVTKLRYENWDDLIGYCQYSAMPVGRFVLDVHGEAQTTWGASDALCAALQIVNHLQDCGGDYRALDRVYVPQDALTANGTDVTALGEARASPALRACVQGLAARTAVLLQQSRPLAGMVNDMRLAMEIAVIQSLAEKLVVILQARDPLSEKVHLSKAAVAMTAIRAAGGVPLRRLFSRGVLSFSPVSR